MSHKKKVVELATRIQAAYSYHTVLDEDDPTLYMSSLVVHNHRGAVQAKGVGATPNAAEDVASMDLLNRDVKPLDPHRYLEPDTDYTVEYLTVKQRDGYSTRGWLRLPYTDRVFVTPFVGVGVTASDSCDDFHHQMYGLKLQEKDFVVKSDYRNKKWISAEEVDAYAGGFPSDLTSEVLMEKLSVALMGAYREVIDRKEATIFGTGSIHEIKKWTVDTLEGFIASFYGTDRHTIVNLYEAESLQEPIVDRFLGLLTALKPSDKPQKQSEGSSSKDENNQVNSDRVIDTFSDYIMRCNNNILN